MRLEEIALNLLELGNKPNPKLMFLSSCLYSYFIVATSIICAATTLTIPQHNIRHSYFTIYLFIYLFMMY